FLPMASSATFWYDAVWPERSSALRVGTPGSEGGRLQLWHAQLLPQTARSFGYCNGMLASLTQSSAEPPAFPNRQCGAAWSGFISEASSSLRCSLSPASSATICALSLASG